MKQNGSFAVPKMGIPISRTATLDMISIMRTRLILQSPPGNRPAAMEAAQTSHLSFLTGGLWAH
jgi:hypothetical protein